MVNCAFAQGTDPPHFVQVLLAEFAAAAVCFPVLFSKDPSSGASIREPCWG